MDARRAWLRSSEADVWLASRLSIFGHGTSDAPDTLAIGDDEVPAVEDLL